VRATPAQDFALDRSTASGGLFFSVILKPARLFRTVAWCWR
jgi:hypothetical protein